MNIPLAPHPYANLFPEMSSDAYNALKANITEVGVLEPVMLYQGLILDGRHRERAGIETGQPRKYHTFTGTDQAALDYVIAINANRRHMKKSQLAMVAAAVETVGRKDNRHGTNINRISNTVENVAARFGMSDGYLRRARAIVKSEEEDIIAAVRAGQWSFDDAEAEISKRIQEARELKDKYDERCDALFKNKSHKSAFMRVVTHPNNARLILKQDQLALAGQMITSLGESISSQNIANWIQHHVARLDEEGRLKYEYNDVAKHTEKFAIVCERISAGRAKYGSDFLSISTADMDLLLRLSNALNGVLR